MKTQDLYALFIQELEDVYDAEHQLIAFIPRLITLTCSMDLTEALAKHLKETEDQSIRLERIFFLLDEQVDKKKVCAAMRGLVREAESVVHDRAQSPLLDAAIISAAQKIEHYEIAAYGTLHSFAKHLELSKEIRDLLACTLDEESAADKKLIKIAEGSFLSTGVNQEAVDMGAYRAVSAG